MATKVCQKFLYCDSTLPAAGNVLFTLNRTTHSSKTLLRLVRFNVNKTLIQPLYSESNDPI